MKFRLTYVVRNTDVVPDYEAFIRKDQELQPYGVPLDGTGRTPDPHRFAGLRQRLTLARQNGRTM